jgi:hypothetical protein
LGLRSLRANTEMGTFFYMLPWLYIAVASLSLLILMQRLYFQYKLVNRGSDL